MPSNFFSKLFGKKKSGESDSEGGDSIHDRTPSETERHCSSSSSVSGIVSVSSSNPPRNGTFSESSVPGHIYDSDDDSQRMDSEMDSDDGAEDVGSPKSSHRNVRDDKSVPSVSTTQISASSPNQPTQVYSTPSSPLPPDDTDSILTSLEMEMQLSSTKGWPQGVSVFLYHRPCGLILAGTETGAVYVCGDGFQFVRPMLTDSAVAVTFLVAIAPRAVLVGFEDNSLALLDLPSLRLLDLLPSNWLVTHPPSSDALSSSRASLEAVTSMTCDWVATRPFVFVGTSEGAVRVLDTSDQRLRVVDYDITFTSHFLPALKSAGYNATIGCSMTISHIAVSPKDEKYLAIGLNGSDHAGDMEGAVILYDLMKNKVHKAYVTPNVISLAWHHHGEILYGAVDGLRVLLMSPLEKSGNTVVCWDGHNELTDPDDIEDDGKNGLAISQIHWMPAQVNQMNDTNSTQTGALFILFTNSGVDNDIWTHVNVAIAPKTSSFVGQYTTVYGIPSLPGEKVLAFQVVPTYEKVSCNSEENIADANGQERLVTPGLLMLTQRRCPFIADDSDDEEYCGHFGRNDDGINRQLKILRCPTTNCITDWAMEIGMTPEPRLAGEVHHGRANITAMTAVSLTETGETSHSLSRTLIRGFDEDIQGYEALHASTALLNKAGTTSATSNVSTVLDDGTEAVPSVPNAAVGGMNSKQTRRLSTRAMNASMYHQTCAGSTLDLQFEDILAESENWEMVLASGEFVSSESGSASSHGRYIQSRQQELVALGHSDGTIALFGVGSSCDFREIDAGRGTVWFPLSSIRCGTASVTAISLDDLNGLILCGDEAGYVVLHEAYDPNAHIGALSRLQAVYDASVSAAQKSISELEDCSTPPPTLVEFASDSSNASLHAVQTLSPLRFSQMKEVFRTRFTNETVSIARLYGTHVTCIVGTKQGSVYVSRREQVLKGEFTKLPLEISNALPANVFSQYGGAVKGIEFTYFPISRNLIPSLVIAFAKGLLITLDMVTLEILAYANACEKDNGLPSDGKASNVPQSARKHAGSGPWVKGGGGYSGNEMIFTTNTGMVASTPSLTATLYGMARVERIANDDSLTSDGFHVDSPAAVAAVAASEVKSTRGLGWFSRKSSKSASTERENTASKARLVSRSRFSPEDVPVKLSFLCGQSLTQILLSQFTITSLAGASPLPPGGRLPGIGTHTKMTTTDARLVSTGLWKLSKPASEWSFSTPPSHAYLAALDSTGWLHVSCLRTGKSIGHVNTVAGLADPSIHHTTLSSADLRILRAILLPNGNIFALTTSSATARGSLHTTNGCMLVSTHVMLQEVVFQDTRLPQSMIPTTSMIPSPLRLIHGRELSLQANGANAQKKRRSSVISLTRSSDITDLQKLFSKTKNARDRQALFDLAEGDEDEDDEDEKPVMRTVNGLQKATNEMNELRDALTERGERIDRIVLKMDDFKNSAAEYRQGIAAKKAELEKKNARWGLF